MPAMVEVGEGVLIVIGDTSALRGRRNLAGFARTKAQDLGPKGGHVATLVIDAVIDVPRQRDRLPYAPDAFFISPAFIADEIFPLAHQSREAWSFLAELRPFYEAW